MRIKMNKSFQLIILFIVKCSHFLGVFAEDRILGCNGFIKSNLAIDFSKVEVKLFSKEGNLKDKIECAPNNGYFFLPLYDSGEYTFRISSLHKWVFEPQKVEVNFDGVNDLCSKGEDIIFTFMGFRIFGQVDSVGDRAGPKDITLTLISDSPSEQKEITSVLTKDGGSFDISPVSPGSYILKASHQKWRMSKSLVSFKVETSNFQVPRNSLLFAGYDVTGSVVSSGEPIAGVHFILFSSSETRIERDWIHGCDSSVPKDFDVSDLKLTGANRLCSVTSDEKGIFSFAAVPSGDFVLVPYYKGINSLKFEVHPRVVRFTLSSDSHVFSKPFLVSGFSVIGRVISKPVDGIPIAGLKVVLDKEKMVETTKDGSFIFDGVKTGLHNIQVKGDDYQFKDLYVKIAPNSAILETIYPIAIKLCGNVQKLQLIRIIVIFKDINGLRYDVEINEDGSYCIFLPPGDYAVEVSPSEPHSEKLLWFFPVNHSIKLLDKPLKDVNFRQETAELTGTIECNDSNECEETNFVLRGIGSVEEEYHETTKGLKFKFVDLYPGHYELSVSNKGSWCWEYKTQKIYISEVHNVAQTFKRIGISFTISSSHDTELKYKKLSSNQTILNEGILNVKSGVHQYCLPGDTIYELEPIGCHRYAKSAIRREVGQDSLTLTALSHEIIATIVSSRNVADISVRIYSNDDKSPKQTTGPLKGKKDGQEYVYEFKFQAATNEKLTIVPESSSMLFTPSNLTIHSTNDCTKLHERINAELGVQFEGKVQPALENVKISIRNEVDEVVATMFTDRTGSYKFIPLQPNQKYRITGEKEGYVVSGPMENGIFNVHKLAEIQVYLVDDHNKSLQGVLLSLSGGENYRQTSQSNADGKITFLSLKPGEYYLRPMLKEYKFSPPSKITNIKEGETVTVTFQGHRVLYSVFGHVYSLSHFPEKEAVVEAISIAEGECVSHQEEGTTDDNGHFRIRGLKPHCSYNIRLKQGSNVNKKIHKSLPEKIRIEMKKNDIENINLITIPEASQSDVSVFLESSSAEHLRTLVLRLMHDDGGIVHTIKLNDWKMARYSLKSVLLPLPTLNLDSKNYYIRLESSLPKSTYAYDTQTVYFSANTTFQLIKLSFSPDLRLPDSDVKHSYTSAIIILILGLAYWCKDLILSALSQLQNNSGVTVSEFLNRYSQPPKGKEIEKTFIEIEPGITVVKRKLKPRKM